MDDLFQNAKKTLRKVVIMKADESNRWYDNWVRSKSYFQEANVEIEEL